MRTLMMEMESVCEMLFDLNNLAQLPAQEDFIQFGYRESFKTCISIFVSWRTDQSSCAYALPVIS
jgi:hypothetical protein